MRFYEYESKALFAQRRMPLPKSRLCRSADEARAAAEAIGTPVVLKSQVLSGGRMKAGAVKFADTPAQTAATLIDRAGMTKTRVGGAELSERNSNYVVAHPGTKAADILQLADLVQARVRERTGANLDRELHVW